MANKRIKDLPPATTTTVGDVLPIDGTTTRGITVEDFRGQIALTAGAGLTGGGDLSANRTLDVGAGDGITVNADDVALNTAHVRNVDHTAVTLTAGAGLTGGGDISASRSFAVGAGSGITVNADDVALDATSTRNTDHASVTLTAGAGLTGGGDITASRSFAVGAGAGITVNADDVALAPIADDRIMANISGGSAAPSAQTLSAVLDAVLGNTQGALVTRNAGGWVKLDPGLNGQFLKAQGAGADLAFDTIPGGGDMLSTNNLSDVASVATARTNLQVVSYASQVLTSGQQVQAVSNLGQSRRIKLTSITVTPGAADVQITGIPSSANRVVIQFTNLRPTTDAMNLRMRTAETGTTWAVGASDYKYSHLRDTFGTPDTIVGAASNGDDEVVLSSSIGDLSTEYISGEIVLHRPADNALGTFGFRTWGVDSSGNAFSASGGGARMATAPIVAVQLRFSAGGASTVAAGIVDVYVET